MRRMHVRSRLLGLAAVAAVAAAAAGCAGTRASHTDGAAAMWSGVSEAIAVVHPTKGHRVSGTVRFVQMGDSVHVTADVSGLKPGALHGFHVHEFGDCSADDGASAGGHYNPEGHAHAGPDAGARHAGDLGNLQADASGRARYDYVMHGVTIAGSVNPLLGRGVIVHAAPDDLVSQPTGNAGARIGCGVIGVAQPAAK